MKRLLTVVLAVACLLPAVSNAAYAALQPSNLTVVMKYGNLPLGGINVAVCQVAGVQEDIGELAYTVTQAFSGAKPDFKNLTQERNIALAAALDAYAAANNIQRSAKVTGSDGKATFTGLAAGLYLVAQMGGENSEYSIAPYLVAVPNLNERLKRWEYDVSASPKTEPIKRDTKIITSLSVLKVWAGTDSPPGSILVQLYRNGVPYGNCVTLDAGNQWKYTWFNLNQDGTWTVDEFDVADGYVKKISGSASSGFVITNTRDPNAPQKVLISGSKTWEHGANPIDKRPKSIVLHIYANGVFILQKEVGQSDHWSWNIGMDKYDKDGKEIVYTIDEAPVDDYIKAVDGYDLINVYKHSGPGGPGTPGLPQTNDTNNPIFWLALMGVGFIGLVTVLIILTRRRKRREKNRS